MYSIMSMKDWNEIQRIKYPDFYEKTLKLIREKHHREETALAKFFDTCGGFDTPYEPSIAEEMIWEWYQDRQIYANWADIADAIWDAYMKSEEKLAARRRITA